MKVPILRLLSSLVKICQIPLAIFGSAIQLSFKVPSNITPSSNIVYLVKGSPLKGISLRFLSVWVKLRLNFSCQFWTGRYIPLQILHHSPVSWKITYLHFSNSKILYISSSVKLLNCSRRGATIYYIVSARHHQLKAD